jgi:septal ring factor EnvC (AmiA/AmiB activator)
LYFKSKSITMKKFTLSLIAATLAASFMVSCGPSAEEIAREEQRVKDSIAAVEKVIADSLAAVAAAEQARLDSIAAAEKPKTKPKAAPKPKPEPQPVKPQDVKPGQGRG